MPLPAEAGGAGSGSGDRIRVHPVDFAKLGVTIANGSWNIVATWAAADMGKGWAGGDQAAVAFTQAYDPGEGMAASAYTAMDQATYGFGSALVQMALNYLTAEQASAIETGLYYLYKGQSGLADPHLGGMAEAIWHVVEQLPQTPPDPVAQVWPLQTPLGPPGSQADPATVRQMGSLWLESAGQLESQYGSCDSQVRAVAADNSGTDVTAMHEWWQSLYRPGDASTLLEGTRQLCAALGDFCDSYAGIIDHERSALAVIPLWRAEVGRFHIPQQVIDAEIAAAVGQARQQAAAAVASSPQLARVQQLTGEVATAIDNNSGNIQAVAARTVPVPAPPVA